MIYLGNEAIDSIYFSDYYKKYIKNFTDPEGEVNAENGGEVEFTDRQAIIKKFKIDTGGIRRNIKQSTEIYNSYLQGKINVSGLKYVNDNVVTFGKAYYPTGGWKGFNDETSFAPGKFPNDTYKNCQYVSGLIIQSGGHYSDMSDTVNYPSEQMLMHPGDVGNRTNISDGIITGTWFDGTYRTILIGLYGSLESQLGAVYDISNNPIILTLIPDIIAPHSRECGKVYLGDQIQEKDKTLDNCGIKYNYVTKKGINNNGSLCSTPFNSKIIDPPMITDPNFNGEIQIVDKKIKIIKPWISFNYTAQNSSFWIPIKDGFANNDGTNPVAFYNTHSSTNPSLFGESNIDGELTLNFASIDTSLANILTFPDIIYGTKISKINFNFKEGCSGMSMLNAFRNASSLKEITTNKLFGAKELAGTFEFCTSLTTLPGIFNYSLRNRYNSSNFCYTFEGCTSLTDVLKSNAAESIDSEQNILKTETLTQTFNGCKKLVNFYPILDIAGCPPDATFKAFYGCSSLQHILIKNLNKGDGRFDGTSTKSLGTLDKLDTESVKYLLNNVRDIAHLTPDTETQNNSFGHSSGTRESSDASYSTLYIKSAGFLNYCSLPVETEIGISNTSSTPEIYFIPQDKINTSEMENYKIAFTNNKATISSNGESNYGFYTTSETFKENEEFYINMINPGDRDSSSVTEAKIYIPEVGKTDGRFTQDEIDICNNRGGKIYIGNTELTSI